MIVTVTLNASIDKAYYLDSPVVDGTVHRVSVVDNSAGGKGLNASRAITTLNYPVCATGFVGGNNGRYLVELAHKDGITSDFIYTEQETRSCINILEPSRQSTEFLEPGQPVLPEEFLAFKAKLVQLTKEAEVVTFNGSIPKGISAANYKELIEETMAAGVPCIVDASGTLLTSCVDALPTMIK
ncbi:MAG: 1-phosphofructokinase family hexose kinase, partial [Atopobium sp.]|nr:1-phosphofructokinase family hexose kinase [Atopobium sp.]